MTEPEMIWIMEQSKVQKWTGKSIIGRLNVPLAKFNTKIMVWNMYICGFKIYVANLGSYSWKNHAAHVKYMKPFWNMQYSPYQLENLSRISENPVKVARVVPCFCRLKQRPGAAHLTAWKLDTGVWGPQVLQSLADCERVVYVRTE